MSAPQTATAPDSQETTPLPALSRGVLGLMACACGLAMGANYFNQPLLHTIGQSLHTSAAGLLVTCAQVAYGVGLLLLTPLGDMLERRTLTLALMALATCGLLLSGASPWLPGSFGWLAAGTLMTGLFSVAAQVLVAMAAGLVAPERSGRAVGFVMSELLIGILFGRTVAGMCSGLWGWNSVYLIATAAMVVMTALLARKLPRSRNTGAALSYGQTLLTMARLLRALPRLGSRTLLGGLSFASVSVLFSTMALMLAGPAHRLPDAVIGLIGLAGVAGALMANAAGHLFDRGYVRAVTLGTVTLLLASWLPLALGGMTGWGGLATFIAGMLLIDLALQGAHITNQNLVFRLAPQARARANAVYMTGYFAGAASGSAIGSLAWSHGGWRGACTAGAALAALTLFTAAWDRRLARGGSASSQ
jgi:predicted MFS family arabinose efflux permease